MVPTPAAVSSLLRQVIHYHLDNSAPENALFFAERLVAQDAKSSESVHLYALSHLRLRDYRSAYDVSKPVAYRGTHLGCAWVFAQACLHLERDKEGIMALEKCKGLWSSLATLGKHTATSRSATPDAAAVLCLLGKLHRAYDDKKRAVSCYEEALKMNPFMWDAFTALCDMGVNVRVPNIFRANEMFLQALGQLWSQTAPMTKDDSSIDPSLKKLTSLRTNPAESSVDPFNVTTADSNGPAIDMFVEPAETDFMSKIQAARLRLASSTNSQPGGEGQETPTGSSTDHPLEARVAHTQEPPKAPTRRARTATVDAGAEGPPRMNYRLGAKRIARGQERAVDDPMDVGSETNNALAPSARSAIPAIDRKRTVSGHPVARPAPSADEQTARRSARLNMFKPSAKVNSGATTIGASAGREMKKARPQISRIVRPGSSGSSVGRVVSGNRKPLEDQNGPDIDHGESARVREAPSQTYSQAKPAETDSVKLEEALRWTLDLIKKLGSGYFHLSRYQCSEVLQSLNTLSTAHQNTPWVLAQLGRAHFEQAAYAEAEKFFRKLRVNAPSRLQDMEVYSTILWHLKRETDLSFLAHELVDLAWHSPHAWCALGNAWSLARDPEQALKCFKRATQLDPKFAYAFTLQGHEHVASEEYDKALTAYRQAIAADRRHYNAYYGIGRVQERLGHFEKAHIHFQAAQSINPNNPVLICCIGTVLEKMKQIMPALQAYSRAAELAPKAALTRYKKARGLLAIGDTTAAQNELQILKDLAPDDGMVHFLLGTLYRSLNEKQLAVRHFTIALALDPKVRLPLTLHAMKQAESLRHYCRLAPKSKRPLRALKMMCRWILIP